MPKEGPRKIKVLLSAQRALLGAVTPNLRRVYADWDENEIDMYFIFDGEISSEDKDNAECVGVEVIADFDLLLETKFLRIDFPQPVPKFGKVCVYARKEVYT